MALPCRICSPTTVEVVPNGRVERFVISDVGTEGTFFVVPVSVTSNSQTHNVEYLVKSAAVPILQHACTVALRYVSTPTLDNFFRWMGWPNQKSQDSRLGSILEGFADEWGMTLSQRAYCFQQCHKLTAAALNRAAALEKKNAKVGLTESDIIPGMGEPGAEPLIHPYLGQLQDVNSQIVNIDTKLACTLP